MGKVLTKEIEIYYVDEYEIERKLPCAFYESKPRFRWTLPRGVVQKGFIFEMRTRYPKNYTVLEQEVNRCGYMFSGMQNSVSQEYRVYTSIIYKETDGIQTDSTYDTWHGTCEVRLRIFGTDGNEYSTHAVAPYDTVYDFEIHADGAPNSQRRLWGSKNNAYYFCFDPEINKKFNVTSANLVFNSASDEDDDALLYELQVSDMPLFNEGNDHKTFYSVKDIDMHDVTTSITAVFGDSASENPDEIRLEYRKTYYGRARSYDAYDYSEWSTVNAFSVIDNVPPTGTIIGVETPMTVDSLGNTVVAERPNGEMNVTLHVADENDRYVSAWLMFSMPLNASEAEKLTNADNMDRGEELVQTVDVNNSSNSINPYEENTRGKFLRAITKESLLHIPTNRDITVTWHTINDISKDVMRGKVINDGSLYMYLFVDDGYGIVKRSLPYRVPSLDNSALIGNTAAASLLPTEIKIRGGLERNLRFPVLPEDMLRQHIVHTIEKDEDNSQMEPTPQSNFGSIGYTENIRGNIGKNLSTGGLISFNGIYDFYNRQDTALGYNYLQRITQDSGFTVNRYQKYNVIYNDSVVKYAKATSRIPGDEYMRGSGASKIYDEYGNDQSGIPPSGDEIVYIDEDQVNYAGFVSFCPHCNDLHILKTGIKKREWDAEDGKYVSRLYWGNDVELTDPGLEAQKPLLEAFMDAEGESTFDGTPYELVFKCEGCGNIFPMSTKYQKNLSYGVNSLTLKDQYAYWHGYNSDMRLLDNEELQKQLVLTRKKDFELLKAQWVEQWKSEHDGAEPKEEDCPYKWVQTGKINFVPNAAETMTDDEHNPNSEYNTEIVGLMPSDAVLNLNPRPEFEPYMKIIPPVARSHQDELYIDGAKLNASIEYDYMHDYKPQKGGDGEADEPGDPDLMRLAKQPPWWYQPKVTYHYFEGKKALEGSATNGYMGVTSGDEDESDETQDIPDYEMGGIPWSGGATEYRVLARTGENGIQNRGVKFVVKNDDPDHVVTLVINRMSCSGNIKFPVIVERGKNDRYSCVVNGELLYEGSLLEDDESVRAIEFPYVISSSGDTTSVYTIDKSIENELVTMLMKVFGAFDVNTSHVDNSESLMPETFTRYKSEDIWTGISNDKINFDGKSVSFTMYGKTEVGLDTVSSGRYEKFEINWCENSCYELFGITPDVTYQNSTTVFGSINGESPLLKNNIFPEGPAEEGEESIESEPNNIAYAFTERRTTKHKYDVQESPLDNNVEDFISYEHAVEGLEKPLNGRFRKLSVQPAIGEPLFTCYKDEVDENGFHFKFTEDDYRKTGKIYIRKYRVETCNPFPLDGYGYRNWIVVPIEGKPGRYRKKQVFNNRGTTAEPRTILIEPSAGAEPIQDIGWFEPEGEDPATMYEDGIYVGNSYPFSHDRREEKSSSSSSSSSDEEKPIIYKRKADYTWRNQMMPKTCVVFDYMDITEAMCKNPFAPAGESPLNHVAPINFHAGIFDKYIDRYGIYVLGGYDLTDDQKLLQNDNVRYTKEFPWVDVNSGITTTVEASMPNNWRPKILQAGFDAIEAEKRTINCVSIKTGDSEDGSLYTTKSVDSYARFKKAWKGKIPTIEGRELSQYTVEQFNPAFKYNFGIWEKWGYQPKNHVEDYWKKDEDAMYSGKYIPASSRIVHGIYIDPITGVEGDPFADERLRGETMRERNIISDKSLMKERNDYDRLPYLDYRLTGKISLDILPYFSGYPRSEHPTYETRPEPPYPYDRQWRIGGYREFERGSFEAQKDNESFEMIISPGAQIAELATYSSTHSFLYLQDEWNGYNRLHWSVDVGKGVLLCLSAQEIFEGSEVGSPFSVKTKNSFWNEDITIDGVSAGAWCIKYNKSLSDTIDIYKNVNENGDCLFHEHSYYEFKLNSFSVDGNGTITTGDTQITSHEFTIFREAVSPATIIDTIYDPWTRMLTINFRFDDALGRNYDIVGFKYTANDSVVIGGTSTYISEDDFITPGGEGSDGTGILIGNLHDLESNRSSLYLDNNATLNTHSVQVKIDSLGITSTANMRVILLSALSSERMGLTLPVFTVKMWANEFLKPIEERIMSLQGYKSHWKWVETYDEEADTTTGEWEYLEGTKAIPVMGKIQETQGLIDEISDKFDNWFAGSSKFIYGGIDAFECWLKIRGGWDEFYYSYIFQTFINWHEADDYDKEYEEYINTVELSLPSTKARKWLEKMGHAEEYKAWYATYRFHLLASYRQSLSAGGIASFEAWVKTTSSISEARIEFAEANIDAYKSYYGIVDVDEEESSSDSSSSDSSSSSSSFVIADAEALEFIEESGLEENFILFLAIKNRYADTRFLERALIMSKLFGVTTDGIWEKQHENPPYAGEYQTWLGSPDASVYDELNISDLYQLFLITMGCLEKKTDIIQANDGMTFPIDEEYATSVAVSSEDMGELAPTNVGRAAAFSDFLQSPSGTGTSYSLKWQALNNTLAGYNALLYQCIGLKTKLETDFRRNLIRQGYFCNGFLNNQPYNSGETNTCFRWRVETRQYEGKMDMSETDGSYGSYDTRYDMYYHFQMDFFDTFNSQMGGKPATDIIFIDDEETDDSRIIAGIDDVSGIAKTTPYEADKTESRNYVPTNADLVVDKSENEKNKPTKNASSITNLQFSARFGIEKEDLPKIGSGITVPNAWKQAWTENEPRTEAPDDSGYVLSELDYKGAYYWRVAPYNLLNRPIFDAQLGMFAYDAEGKHAILENIFHADDIDKCLYKYEDSLYVATSRRDGINLGLEGDGSKYCPIWKANLNSVVGDAIYKDDAFPSPWINSNALDRGDVQFVTDRPRKIEYVLQEGSHDNANMNVVSYFITNENGCKLARDYYGSYEPIYSTAYVNDNDCYIFKGTREGQDVWFIGTERPEEDNEQLCPWEYYTSEAFPDLTTNVCDSSGIEYRIRIVAKYEEASSSSGDFLMPVVSFIDDNIGNYNTQWIPSGATRKKPFVIRLKNQYLMFTNKQIGTISNDLHEYKAKVITVSRGFSSNLFGEEGMCIPRYTVENIGDYVSEIINVGSGQYQNPAVSVENPSVVSVSTSMWRMYFNAVFYENGAYVTKLYKADTTDFDGWFGIEKVTVTKDSVEKFNYLQPNVNAEYNQDGTVAKYIMFASSTDHYITGTNEPATGLLTIKRLESTNGINFEYREEIYNITYGYYDCCSPCLMKTGESGDLSILKLYFSIESRSGDTTASVIVSLEGTEDSSGVFSWNSTPYLDRSNLILEKGNDSFVASGDPLYINVVAGKGRVFSAGMTSQHYYDPFVLWDIFNGCPVQRMYYNAIENPYLWEDKILKLKEDCHETVIKTEYFEEYNYTRISIEATDYSGDGGSTWTTLPSIGYTRVIPASSNGGVYARFKLYDFQMEGVNVLGIMKNMEPQANVSRCMAQGEWIDYNNVANTEALLLPEINNEIGYSLERYSPINWIMENDIYTSFTTWMVDNDIHPETSNALVEKAIEWLIETRNYPRYLWWSRKGAGIYRYLGYDALSGYSW